MENKIRRYITQQSFPHFLRLQCIGRKRMHQGTSSRARVWKVRLNLVHRITHGCNKHYNSRGWYKGLFIHNIDTRSGPSGSTFARPPDTAESLIPRLQIKIQYMAPTHPTTALSLDTTQTKVCRSFMVLLGMRRSGGAWAQVWILGFCDENSPQ